MAIAPAAGISLLRPAVTITSGSAGEGSGAGASTGDSSVGAAVVLEGALENLEIKRECHQWDFENPMETGLTRF